MSEPASKPMAEAFRRIAKEVLQNWAEFSDDLIAGQFSEQKVDSGGIEPDAYFAHLFADWDEDVRDMGLPADDQTFRRYMYVWHRQLFEQRKNVFGETVTSEVRIPPRLTPDENYQTVERVKREMELVSRGSTTLMPDGRLDWEIDTPVKTRRPRPSEVFATPETPNIDLSRPKLPSDVFGVPERTIAEDPVGRPSPTWPPTEIYLDPDASQEAPTIVPRRKRLPSDVFGVPDEDIEKSVLPLENDGEPREPLSRPSRPMRPDDPFGMPGTPIFREDVEPVIPVPSATAHSPHTYSMSIRPGETKTQVIELPGLTLELVITMPSLLPRPV